MQLTISVFTVVAVTSTAFTCVAQNKFTYSYINRVYALFNRKPMKMFKNTRRVCVLLDSVADKCVLFCVLCVLFCKSSPAIFVGIRRNCYVSKIHDSIAFTSSKHMPLTVNTSQTFLSLTLAGRARPDAPSRLARSLQHVQQFGFLTEACLSFVSTYSGNLLSLSL